MANTLFKENHLFSERYLLTEEQQGSHIARVFLGRENNSGRSVLIHVIRPEFIDSPGSNERFFKLLERRAQLLQENIVAVLAIGLQSGFSALPLPYWIEEAEQGRTLREALEERSSPFNLRQILTLLQGAQRALSYMHRQQVLAHNLNPSCLYLSPTGGIKLKAFAYSSVSEWLSEEQNSGLERDVDYRYVAPESLVKQKVLHKTAESDVYLLGLLAFELACGTPPFDANTETLIQMQKCEPPALQRLSQAGLSPWYIELVSQCLNKKPEARPSLSEVAKILEAKLSGDQGELSIYPAFTSRKDTTVLFVEDNRLDQLAFARFCKRENLDFDFIIAANVDKARECLAQRKIDVVISDFMLPDGTGADVVRAAGKIPTIILTGAGKEQVARDSLRAGAFDYIAKDFKRSHLTQLALLVNRALEHVRGSETAKDEVQNLLLRCLNRVSALSSQVKEASTLEQLEALKQELLGLMAASAMGKRNG